MRTIALIVVAALAPSCFHEFDDEDPEHSEVLTPQGYYVTYIDNSKSVESGLLTIEQVYQMHADSVARAGHELNNKYVTGISLEAWVELAKGIKWIISDHYLVDDECKCVGRWWDKRTPIIELGLWDKSSYQDGSVRPVKPMPAANHELGHAWFGPMFEHEWRPELRQP